jgi:hypothetical protein
MNRLENLEKSPILPWWDRHDNYARAPWYAAPLDFLGMVGAFGLAFSLVVVLVVIAPVAAARAAGLGFSRQLAAPIMTWLFLNIVIGARAWATSAFGHSDDEDSLIAWADTRTWTVTPDPSMGAWLRREREERGLSISAISAKTRIPTKYLRAIEEDRFELLPGGILRRSFLRQYAEQVGLTPGTIVALFDMYVHGRTGLNAAGLVHSTASGVAMSISTVINVKLEVLPAKTPLGHRAATTLFGIVEALLPKRLAHEELGDALEYIAAHPRGWRVIVKIVSSIFWIGVNAVREWRSAFGRKTQ